MDGETAPEGDLTTIRETFTKDNCSDDVKICALHNLKKKFKPPNKLFQHVRLESLIENAWISLQYKTPTKDFLLKYGSALINFFGRDASLNPSILQHLNFVLTELQKQDENLSGMLASDLWHRLEVEGLFPKEFLNTSKVVIEKTVLDWVQKASRVELHAKMAASSPELFQTLTSVLHQVLIRSQGHQKVLEVTQTFVRFVLSVCREDRKDFLGLYPKDCRRLVSLLMVSTKAYSEEKEVTKKEVGELLLELFWKNRNRALILVSHYPEWMTVLKSLLDEG